VKKIIYSILICLCVNSTLYAAEKTAVISRDTNLFAKPFKDADVLAELSSTTAITIVKRKGGWYQIKTPDKQGWVRLTYVRLDRKKNKNQGSDSGSNVGELLTGLATGREKSDEVSSATAIKGLSEEELQNAEPDVDALNSLDNFAVDESSDNSTGLQTRNIDFVDSTGHAIKPQSDVKNTSDEEEL